MIRCLLPLVLLFSCGNVSFDVDQDLAEQTVPGSPIPNLLPSFLPNPAQINVNIQDEVAKRGTGPAKAAYLKSLTLSITPHDAPKGNFDFISEVHLFVEGPGLNKAEVAKLVPVPKGQTKLDFTIVPDVDLLPYVNAGATITANETGTQPAMDTKFDGHIIIEVRI